MSSTITEDDSGAYKAALPFNKIPTTGGLSALPFIGPMFLFKPFSPYPVEQYGQAIKNLHGVHGPIFRLRRGKDWMVFFERLEDADIVFRSKDANPYRTPLMLDVVYNKRSKVPIHNLATLNGPEWKRLRSPLNARMNRPRSVTHYLPAQEQVAVDFADRLYSLQGSDPKVLTDVFFCFATESVGVVCFNKRLGFLDENAHTDASKKKMLWAYKHYIRSISEVIFGKRILYRLYEDPFYKEYKRAKETIIEHSRHCIQEANEEITRRQKEGTFDPDEPNFLLSLLAEKTLDDQDIFGTILSLMGAGSDSTACGLQLLFYALATNPDKQEKVAEEVLTHMGRDGQLTAPVLDKLSYMTAAVKESMRLYFPVPTGSERHLETNTVLSGYQVPKGTVGVFNAFGNATSPLYYHNPMSFSPERWLRDQGGQRERDINPLAYIPFGIGARICIGRRFALQELYLAAAKTLQKYHIGLKEDRPEFGDTTFTPFQAPKHPLPFTFELRQ
ncbi:hypothetical protein V1264_002138 [Littorina saxatilis]